MTKHTPTPWKVVENKRLSMVKINHTQWCERGETSDIAQIFTSLDVEKDKANAAFIVKAVNCHDALVHDVEKMIAIIERADILGAGDMTLDLAKITLAKAKGE